MTPPKAGAGAGRRSEDPSQDSQEPRDVLFNEAQQRMFMAMSREVAANTATQVFQLMSSKTFLGSDPETHKLQHDILAEVIPWLQAQKALHEKKLKFWDEIKTENIRRTITFGIWILVAAAAIGLSGAWHLFLPHIVP